MASLKPGIVVTGASGFVGRHFIAATAGQYRLFCLARRSRREAGVPDHPDLRWTQVDIADWNTLRDVISCIKNNGGADFVLHLAGYYDFHNMENPEYDRTNVQGTRNVLKLARQLGVQRFILASSLAACRFPARGEQLTEDSPADARFAYARSKHRCEELARAEAGWFPTAIVRIAAVYSDWCEYPPLYMQLQTWLAGGWNARILGGKGESAVPYIHIRDLVRCFLRIMEKSGDLPRVGVYNASPDQVTTHGQLYEAATRYYFGETPPPIRLPRRLCGPGVFLRYWLGRLMGRTPFEAPWMTAYIDRQLTVDASRTRQILDWSTTPRLGLERRLLLLIDNLKSNGEAWRQRNEAALQRVARRPSFILAQQLEDSRELLVDRVQQVILDPASAHRFPSYQEMDATDFRWSLMLLLQVLVTATRSGERHLVRQFAQYSALRRLQEGVAQEQVQDCLLTTGRVIAEELLSRSQLEGLQQQVHDAVTLSFQLAADGVADMYELSPSSTEAGIRSLADQGWPEATADMQNLVRRLEDICQDTAPFLAWSQPSSPKPASEVPHVR